MDVFLMDGDLVVIPCENKFFEYGGRFENLNEIP